MKEKIEECLHLSRKLNRSIDNLKTGYHSNEFEGLTLEELYELKKSNDAALVKLYAEMLEKSPYKNIVPVVLTEFETGAIVYDSWGYDQTNIDFYCIVKRAGDFVTLLPMKKRVSAEIGFMTNDNTPDEIDFTVEPVRKKVKSYNGKESGFSMRAYTGGGWVSLYEGSPKRSTHYA